MDIVDIAKVMSEKHPFVYTFIIECECQIFEAVKVNPDTGKLVKCDHGDPEKVGEVLELLEDNKAKVAIVKR